MLSLDLFCRLAETSAAAWASRGASAHIDRSPADGRDKAAAWLSIEFGTFGGQLTVWDSGECDLCVVSGELPDEPLVQYREGLVDQDLPELLADFDKALRAS